ncbi:MAG: hypothetical protein CXR31_11535 [Geobacter sp.]|nr:MAG: hypothetical protein CXR31_11535 [Geobacter sp.]
MAMKQFLVNEIKGSDLLDYAFVTVDGMPYVSTFSKGIPVTLLQQSAASDQPSVWEFQDTAGRVFYDIRSGRSPGGTVLHLGLKRRAIDRQNRNLIVAIVVISLVTTAAGILLAVVLARRATREIGVLADALRSYRDLNCNEAPAIFATSSDVEELVQSFKLLTEQRRLAAEEIQILNMELEQRVKDRTSQLEAANEELDAFAYSVSHDLRAPLRGIDGFSLALLEDYEDKLDAQGKDYLHRIRNACVRMGRLIDDLLGLSRITRGEMHLEAVNLSDMVRNIAEELQRSEEIRGVEFQISPTVVADADPVLIRTVLENLVGNAWKFTRRTDRPRIEFGVTGDIGSMVYFVRDNGAGFNMEYVDRLFSAFQRLHKSDEFEGTGIGLASVQRIIHRHGGRIWAEGAEGEGATFYFTLGGGAQ